MLAGLRHDCSPARLRHAGLVLVQYPDNLLFRKAPEFALNINSRSKSLSSFRVAQVFVEMALYLEQSRRAKTRILRTESAEKLACVNWHARRAHSGLWAGS